MGTVYLKWCGKEFRYEQVMCCDGGGGDCYAAVCTGNCRVSGGDPDRSRYKEVIAPAGPAVWSLLCLLPSPGKLLDWSHQKLTLV